MGHSAIQVPPRGDATGTQAPALMLDAALEYAGRGIPVFPVWGVVGRRCLCGRTDCDRPGKHPIGRLVLNGVKNATTDDVTIRAWWREEPKANIGTPTGEC